MRNIFRACLAGPLLVALSSAQVNYQFPPLAGQGQESTFRTQAEIAETAAGVLARYADKTLAGYGILDVTKAPYNAKPDGKTDNTAALRQAIKDARDARLILYLPPGVYAVRDTIQCVQGAVDPRGPGQGEERLRGNDFPCVVQGASGPDRAVLRLLPGSEGFGDQSSLRPLLAIWAREWNSPYGLAPNVSFSQMVRHLDIDLGGNAGAVGIDMQGAQGTTIYDVAIDARGAWAGVRGLPGSGGSTRGLTVRGGRYGIYAAALGPYGKLSGAQPTPLIASATFREQDTAAIYYDGRGPLVLAGASFSGRGIVCRSTGPAYNGALSVVDTVFDLREGAVAIDSTKPVHADNVWVRGAGTVVRLKSDAALEVDAGVWTRLREFAAAPAGPWPVWVDGKEVPDALKEIDGDAGPPPDDLLARHQPPVPAEWDSPGVVNAREDPYGAKGDGKADDADAIQRALDENDAVFLPKGRYKISRPLRLGAHSVLVGAGPAYTILSPIYTAAAYSDAASPNPLVETVDDADASSVLALLQTRVVIPGAYAVHWRAGRNSVVSDVRFFTWPFSGKIAAPLVLIEGNGGGRWYNAYEGEANPAEPDYRHFAVRGTREPLAFYMFNPEHARSDAMAEFDDAQNVSIYAMKAETIEIGNQDTGTRPLLVARDSSNLRIFGLGGIIGAAGGSPDYVFRFENCSDLLLSNFSHQDYAWFADPKAWSVVVDVNGESEVDTPGSGHFTLYRRGSPHP